MLAFADAESLSVYPASSAADFNWGQEELEQISSALESKFKAAESNETN